MNNVLSMINYKRVEKILLIILEGLIYLSFLMPFVFVSTSIFPFIVGKILYFQGLVQLMAVVYLLLLVINFKKFRPRKTLLLYWFGFYALSLLLSAIFGVDFRRAFWSNFERMTGVFVVWHFIAYAIMVSIVFDAWPKIKRALDVLLAVSLLQVFVIAAQYTKEGVYLYANIGGRVWGTLGNSIYIGSYFLFHIFFASLLAFKEKKQIWQIVYLIIAILEAFIILHSKSSRGADIAILFGILTVIFSYAIFAKTKNIRRAGIGALLIGIVIFTFLIIFRNADTVKNIPVIGSVVNISLNEGTGRTRAIAWEIAWKTFKEMPVLGIGLENFYYTFNSHYNPESLLHSYYETWFDRSHSILFDTLSMGGIIGFFAYFGLYVIGGASLFIAWRRKLFNKTSKSILIGQEIEVDRHMVIFFFIIFSIYIIQNLFIFEHPASYFLIYFSFGLLLSLIAGKRSDISPKYEFSYSAFFAITGFFLIVFFILLFGTTIKTYKVATGVIRAESTFVNNYKLGADAYKELLSMDTPFIFDIRSSMIKRIARVNDNILTTNPDYKSALLFARENLLEQIEEGGKDVYDYILAGQIDMILASSDSKYLDSAESFFIKASQLSPKRQQIYYTWAKVKLMKGDTDGAKKMLKEVIELDPRVPESYWYLAFAYEKKGEEPLMWENIKKAIDKNYSWKSSNELLYAAGLAEELKEDGYFIKLCNLAIEQNPSADLYLRLGLAYRRQGDETKAYEAFSNAQKLNPDLFK